MVCPGGNDLQQLMQILGFERLGKDYVYPKNKLYVEFPSSALGPHETTQIFKLDKHWIKIVSIEDLIVDRLCAFKFLSSALDGLNSILLLESNPCNEQRLHQRAQQEEVWDALEVVKQVRETVIRKKLSPKQSNRLLEKTMRSLKKST